MLEHFEPSNPSHTILTVDRGYESYNLIAQLSEKNNLLTVPDPLYTTEWEFPPSRLKEIYHMRWHVECAFRQLKYAVGMMNFHAKKVEYIKQEIFAKLIVYNFSEIIASHAAISINTKKKNKHNYKLNYSMACKICHKFLKSFADIHPPDVIGWIQRFLSVNKSEDRVFPRNLRGIGAVSFHYRVA